MKQRLVGGLVLVALAVIFVPLILDFRKDYDHVIRGTNIPPKPDDFHVEVVPLKPPEETLPPAESLANSEADISNSAEAESAAPPPAPAPVEKKPVEKKPAAEKPVAKPEAEKPAAAKAPATEVKKPVAAAAETKPAKAATVEKAPAKTTAASADENAWVIQVGSFSNVKNAANLRDKLQSKGYEAFIDDVRVDDRTIHRVRIGPLDKKAAADAVRDKLAIEMKLDARVFSYP